MSAAVRQADDKVDAGADMEIAACLDLDAPKSFFLFAGAGSGKTRSLVTALGYVKSKYERRLQIRGQRVAVITYTNAARDEIRERLEFDPLVQVSTIHSFVWSLIKGYNSDIRAWLTINIQADIAEVTEASRKGRAGTKAAIDREKRLEIYNARLDGLGGIRQFIYSPDGDNRGRDSLNHAEVIKIGAAFLTTKEALRGVLINRYPILLIDESQDTNRVVMEALLGVQISSAKRFVLGLFGDTMQRIYADGIADIASHIPANWATPAKKMNHRCPVRVVTLINKIRAEVDDHAQQPRSDAAKGIVRVFLAPSGSPNKSEIERGAAAKMMEMGKDAAWSGGDIKTLILEHHMAARRMDFLPMFESLARSDRLRMGMLDGSLSALRWFSKIVWPLIAAKRQGDEFRVASIVRSESPLLSRKVLKAIGPRQPEQIERADAAVKSLIKLWEHGEPSFRAVLTKIAESGLFAIPDALKPISSRTEDELALIKALGDIAEDEEDLKSDESAYDAFLDTPFRQIEPYDAYVEGLAQFDTHQGVKGLEFPRVMVIADDTDARGFLFSYDKLFGVKDKTDTDRKNEAEGKETGIDRTRRLFYVTCSRAENELAIVAYSENPEKVRDNLIANGWFSQDEIEVLE
jgi:DNA helicase-2/ATP-dependent DNA helicase PcrA